jgi:hypothetical protein
LARKHGQFMEELVGQHQVLVFFLEPELVPRERA